MKKIILIAFALALLVVVAADTFEDALKKKIVEEIAEYYPMVKPEKREELATIFLKQAEYVKSQPQQQDNLKDIIVPFNCTPFRRSDVAPPTNVHTVKLPYIDVVAALGDSLTAGFGAKGTNILNMFTEFRGVSFSIGGDATLAGSVLTLPNLIKMYNPNVQGFSIGTGGASTTNAHYNQAVSGAVASDLLDQARTLYSRMAGASNFMTSYKLITVFIGGNDLCACCNDWAYYSTANYTQHIRNVLDYIKAHFPNTIVNLMPALDVTELYELSTGFCYLVHTNVCNCGIAAQDIREQVTRLQLQYVQAAVSIANSPEYNTNNFTVVLQPYMAKTYVPQINGGPDYSYFAMDCFHLSEKGHQVASIALFNNMAEKVGQKVTFWNGPRPFVCPSRNDFIWTNRN